MLFDRLFAKRRTASPPPSPEDLLAVALGGGDTKARLEAVRALADLPSLSRVIEESADLRVGEVALACYRDLLCAPADSGPAAQERLRGLAALTDQRVIEHVATKGEDPAVRRAAIDRLESPSILADCVLGDPLAANRAAALARVTDRACLERIARHIGKKDKGVHREVKERLRKLAEAQAIPDRVRAQCAELCERVESLGRLGQWSQDHALLQHLDQQWAGLESEPEAPWRERYRAARERFLDGYQAHRAANAAAMQAEEARAARIAEYTALIAASREGLELADAAALEAAHHRLDGAWSALPPIEGASAADLRQQFRQAQEALQRRCEALMTAERSERDLARARACAEALLSGQDPLDAKEVKALVTQGQSLAKALAQDAPFPAQALTERLESQRAAARERLAALGDTLAGLEQALDAGELKQAEPLHQRAEAALELAEKSGLTDAEIKAMRQRLRTLSPRLGELRHWRRWGADQHREALCEAMEQLLADQELPLPAAAERLRVLQLDWKELDGSGSPGNRGLWKRFHAASDAVYERVRPVLDAEAAEREANRAARERICAELETFIAEVDWERVDWKRVMRAERETRAAWSALGACEARQRRQLGKRYQQAIKALDQRLKDEQARNQAHKAHLIESARALIEESDLDRAIEGAKALQQQWHTTVPARQREENRLWSEFRGACDAVFQRRVTRAQAARAELDANLAHREALCVEAETLAGSASDLDALARAERALGQRWRDAESLMVPRQALSALSRRWSHARALIEDRRVALEAESRALRLDALAAHAALAERVERQVLGLCDDHDTLSPEAADAARRGLPPCDHPGVTARLDAALAALGDAGAAAALADRLAPNGEQRRALCLEIEIAAGVESPPELAQARLERQVSRLAEHMGAGGEASVQDLHALLGDWYACGPAQPEPALQARIAAVRTALGAAAAADNGPRDTNTTGQGTDARALDASVAKP